jgi:hypothetical protein
MSVMCPPRLYPAGAGTEGGGGGGAGGGGTEGGGAGGGEGSSRRSPMKRILTKKLSFVRHLSSSGPSGAERQEQQTRRAAQHEAVRKVGGGGRVCVCVALVCVCLCLSLRLSLSECVCVALCVCVCRSVCVNVLPWCGCWCGWVHVENPREQLPRRAVGQVPRGLQHALLREVLRGAGARPPRLLPLQTGRVSACVCEGGGRHCQSLTQLTHS